MAKRHTLRLVARRRALITLLGGKCVDCGYDKHIAALEFDHVRGVKLDTVARLLSSANWGRVMQEVEKCELVCSNCHSIRTYGRLYA